MAENEQDLIQEERKESEPKEQAKTPWQLEKESWYDKIPLSLKQLDILIAVCWVLLGLTVVAMYLDTTGILEIF